MSTAVGRDFEDESETVLFVPVFADLDEAEAGDRGQGRHIIGTDRRTYGLDRRFGRGPTQQVDQDGSAVPLATEVRSTRVPDLYHARLIGRSVKPGMADDDTFRPRHRLPPYPRSEAG